MQLELSFPDHPFILRMPIEEGVRIFRANYWDHLPSGRRSEHVWRKILVFFKGQYLDSLSKADVERFRRFYKGAGYSDSYINKLHMSLSRLFSKWYEYKEGRFLNGTDFSMVMMPEKNPAAQVPKVNETQFARKLEITRTRKKILCSFCDEDLYEIADTLWWSTLRPGDLFRVSSENVNVEKALITGIQNKTKTTRNPSGLPYRVHIPKDKIEMIKRRLETTKPGTPIFRKKNLQKRWAKVKKFAATIDPELIDAQLRDIRGGGISDLLRKGYDLETLRKKGGWASLDMIPIYDKRQDEPLKKATEELAKV